MVGGVRVCAGHDVISVGKVVVAICQVEADAVVALVVVGVVHEDVKDHAFEQFFAHGGLPVRVAQAQQDGSQVAVALFQPRRAQCGVGGLAVHAVGAQAVKPLNGEGMALFAVAHGQLQHGGAGNVQARLGGQRHGGVLDQRGWGGIVIAGYTGLPAVGCQSCAVIGANACRRFLSASRL